MTQNPQDSTAWPVLLMLPGKTRSRAGTARHLCASLPWCHAKLEPLLAWLLLPMQSFLLQCVV